MSQPSSVIFMAFIRRRADLSAAQFSEHWEKTHGPKIALWAKKHGLTEYTQFHPPSEAGQGLTDLPAPQVVPMRYDGAVVWEFPTMAQFVAAFADPYYAGVIAEDEKAFLDVGAQVATLAMGRRVSVLARGEPLVDCTADQALFDQYQRAS